MESNRKLIKEVKYLKKQDIEKLREYFEKKNKIVLLGIVNISVNTGLRISDVLDLKFENIKKDTCVVIEKKTNKKKEIFFNDICLNTIKTLKEFYINKNIIPSSYIFKSLIKNDSHISYSAIIKYLKLAEKDLKLNYPIGTHSFRKTWGHYVYKNTKDIALLMTAFNHSSPAITLRYIGIEQEDIKKIMKKILI